MLDAAYESARRVCRHHAKSFYFASHFLPKQKRLHAYAVYAFCRRLDDAVDESDDVEREFARFADLLDRAYAGDVPADAPPDVGAFADTVRACAIPKAYFADLAEGCRMDLSVTRYADWAALERYCYHVAGVVGLVMCRVFGLRDEGALAQAVRMGNAMQLTNVLRDVKEDRQRGRVYLPQDELARFGVTESDLDASRATPQLKALIAFNIARARQLYIDAAHGLKALPADGSRQTACVMAVVYAGILGALERQGGDPLVGRARLGRVAKLRRVPLALRLSRATAVDARFF